VADDLAPIKRYPIEGCVRKLVDIVPTQLLSKESSHAGQSAQLRELAGVPKGVRQPKCLASFSKIALEEALPVYELSDKGLATRQVSIMLNPAASDRLESALLDLVLDSVKDIRIVLFEPLVLLCLGDGKSMFWVTIHQIALVRPGSGNLPLRLSPRPKPAGIDMALTNTINNRRSSSLVDLR